MSEHVFTWVIYGEKVTNVIIAYATVTNVMFHVEHTTHAAAGADARALKLHFENRTNKGLGLGRFIDSPTDVRVIDDRGLGIVGARRRNTAPQT